MLIVVFALLAAASTARAAFPIFAGDPTDARGRAWAVLPGVPLLLPQPDGKFDPPIVDGSVIGDVDLVVRAATVTPGPLMPPPVATPPTGVAGGSALGLGTDVPFTVLVSNGGAGLGVPLAGPEMNGIPVVVIAFADFDGDGWIGPTNADDAGAGDNARERQESDFPVGRQVAVFFDGAAEGSVAVRAGAPASAGGLSIVLTALAYVGPFSPGFFEGNVPDGPGVATALPFFPRLDPDRVVDGEGRGGPADPDERLGFEVESDFDPPVNHPVLGTPFALRTDGSVGTIDRARVVSGAQTRVRFVQPSLPAPLPAGGGDDDDEVEPLPLMRGAGGVLLEPLDGPIALADDGLGGAVEVALVPVDRFDNATDPTAGASVTLVADPTLRIVAPDTDGDPLRETIALTSAATVSVHVDDAGGAGDSAGSARLRALVDGYPVASLPFTVAGNAPAVLGVALAGTPVAVVAGCRATRTVVASVHDALQSPTVRATVSLDGQPIRRVRLRSASLPPGVTLPPGNVYAASLGLPRSLPAPGTITLAVTATAADGSSGAPRTLVFPLLTSSTPVATDVTVSPDVVTPGPRTTVVVAATLTDACGIRRAVVELDDGSGFRRVAKLNDRGRGSDPTAADARFTGLVRVAAAGPATLALRVVATNGVGVTTTSAPTTLQVLAD